VWIATSMPVSVRGELYLAEELKAERTSFRPPPIGTATTSALRLGDQFYVALVQITPDQKRGAHFSTTKLLAYDLVFVPIQEVSTRGPAAQKRLPEVCDGIAYAPYFLPTFRLRQKDPAQILHGSCHKLHGAGKNCLAAADEILKVSVDDETGRPTALFLTGDQIYADDVAEEITDYIGKRASELLGFDETIPYGHRRQAVRSFQRGLRGNLVKEFFTPDSPNNLKQSSARNHLLGFGEFAMMYLLSLNEANWPDGTLSSVLEETRQELPRVRRVLANIPTYMICDDHEITDDWNLFRQWRDTVLKSDTGKRIIANGLAAYWAFQAWGDHPDLFGTAIYNAIDHHLEHERNMAKGKPGFQADPFDDTMLKIHWDFVAPTHPPAVFIDSRTRRGFDEKGNATAQPALLGAEALAGFGQMLDKIGVQGGIVLAIAATPVIGIPDAEADLEGRSDAALFDKENWHGNRQGFADFMTAIHKRAPKACIFLSGDLHYAFVTHASLEANQRKLPIFQFTSSALKNAHDGKFVLDYLDKLNGKQKGKTSREKTAAGSLRVRVLPIFPNTFLSTKTNLGHLAINGDTLNMFFYFLSPEGKLSFAPLEKKELTETPPD
jgi:hypothetical protein